MSGSREWTRVVDGSCFQLIDRTLHISAARARHRGTSLRAPPRRSAWPVGCSGTRRWVSDHGGRRCLGRPTSGGMPPKGFGDFLGHRVTGSGGSGTSTSQGRLNCYVLLLKSNPSQGRFTSDTAQCKRQLKSQCRVIIAHPDCATKHRTQINLQDCFNNG